MAKQHETDSRKHGVRAAFKDVICIATSALLALMFLPAAAAGDEVFDVAALSSTPLNARVLASREGDGIVTEEVQFHSERDGDKDVEIFAFFSYPRGAKGCQAYIWNPGGLGQASPGF